MTLTVVNGSFITSIDTVYFRLQGTLHQLGGVISKGYSLSGSIISATVNGCSTGLSTITFVDELIKISPLNEGAYKIKAKLVEYDNFVNPNCNVQKASTSDSININIVTYTGISENKQIIDNVKLYPNPTKNKISIDGFGLQDARLTIFNTLGQGVMSFSKIVSKQEIDLSILSTGLYYITIQKGSYQKTSKLFKE